MFTLLFIWNFPSAILTYWCTSNIISLFQVALLKQKNIRKFLKIPPPIKYSPEQLPKKQKGFIASMYQFLIFNNILIKSMLVLKKTPKRLVEK